MMYSFGIKAALISQVLVWVVSANLFDVATKQTRIIGGSEAPTTRYSYTVALTQGGSNFFCGGTLIAPDVVLTAAHCMGGSYNVAIGRHDLTSNGGEEIAMSKEIKHPNYNTGTDENDFALVILSKPTTLDIPFVKLNSDESFPSAGTMSRSMGWGDMAQSDDKTEISDVLMEVDVPVITNDECSQASGTDGSYTDSYANYIYPSMLCTFESGKDACQGDSGGPLIVPGASDGEDVQVGVVSWGIGCATKVFPGVFSRVSHVYDWIQETVCSESSDPSASSLCGPPPTNPPTPKPSNQPTNQPTTPSSILFSNIVTIGISNFEPN
ncbi:predicted protein [Thalassiosira pseudonana CCMP1335]|uniref:Peptidase S1 domain-containing protein n=1 Tax=Thalassiosira pseudonana TaxID=35128 RepID=B8C3Q1_THAPS|nr:predicted protein [Thalassiosira pseudonana CCMP1335]EED92601.1 predicted protein [Thalassiosira pseudonana CCMP1335]